MGISPIAMRIAQVEQILTQAQNQHRKLEREEYETIGASNTLVSEHGAFEEKREYFNLLHTALQQTHPSTEQHYLLLALSSHFVSRVDPSVINTEAQPQETATTIYRRTR